MWFKTRSGVEVEPRGLRAALALRSVTVYLVLAAIGTACSSSPTASVPAGERLFVANLFSFSVTVYDATATGNASPLETIGGNNTGLNPCCTFGVARNAAGQLFVTSSDTILLFAAGATGNASPVAVIGGSNTALSGPRGIALDTAGRLYVANGSCSPPPCGSVTVYAAGASGNATPRAVIAGSNTGLNVPDGIALDVAARLYVTNVLGNSITVYAAGVTGNVAPTTMIVGSNTGLSQPAGIAVDPGGRLYVANYNANSITVYAAGATGNATPTAAIEGSLTGLSNPLGIVLDPGGRLYVANEGNNSVTVYAAGATGNATPAATIVGSLTGLSGPTYITR